MGSLTFRGGVHPYDGKELSKNCPIEKYLPKGEMVYPLSQHIGAPAVPVVARAIVSLPDRRLQMRAALYQHRSIHLYPEL